MKKTLLTFLAIVIGISVSAQKIAQPSAKYAEVKDVMRVKNIADENIKTSNVYIPGSRIRTPNFGPGVNETQIGMTTYDLQTNSATQNRIYAYPDGTVGAVWTMGFTPPATAFGDRGTGYNYFNGTTWGAEPTARIASETLKNGWPSYAPLGTGEVIVSHTGGSNLYLTKRAIKGTGTWTSTLIPNTATYTWPRMITNGNSIHILVNTGALYEGMNGALLYYRSTDAGVTFTGPTIIPGLEASAFTLNANFTGIGGDSYAWAAPRGDSLAFVATDGWGGIWAFKSFNNGLTWTKKTVFTFPSPVTGIQYWSHDDRSAIAMDKAGKVHIVVGRMKVTDDDLTAANSQYYPYTDGLIYWNENMPALDTTLLRNLDSLDKRGSLIGYMQDYNNNDTIDFPDAGTGVAFGKYYSSLSSMPQIAIDNEDNIYVSFSQCREDLMNAGANPNAALYRHLFLTSKMKKEGKWIEPRDLTDDIEHSYDECVWASMSYSINKRLHLVYQKDSEPGYALELSEVDPFGDNFIVYLSFPTFVGVKPVDISKDVMVSPNPATDHANVLVSLTSANRVELKVYDLMGKLVMSYNYGQQSGGYHTYKLNTSNLPGGMYLVNVKIGNSQTSKKIIVK